ncbi:uncharacterized protein LOC125647538 isoform X2 [Ostrea edulis]|uniref:uncharacterized protein LOC125647538 isoform X2 n=1 Tax=Ostrea edulis TaxID=37623 RepID=UPI0024AF8F72|nr:uncharacterized protein LOC125647538 isoform X2 [Ostrea edulis]
MQYNRKLQSIWKNISIVIVSCVLIIRVFSLGYVVGGFILKFHEPLLHLGSIRMLNNLRMGTLPLGSLLNALTISLIPSMFFNTINTIFSFGGICKRSNGCLRASSIMNIIIILYNTIFTGLWTWLIAELNHSIQNSFYEMYHHWTTVSHDKLMWNSKFVPMRCCGFNGTIIDILYTNGCTFSVGCFDYLAGTINTYGSCYIAVLIANIVAGITMIVGTEYLHRLQTIDSKTKHIPRLDRGNIHKFRNGILCQICFILRTNWSRNRLSSLFGCISAFSVIFDGGIIVTILASRFSLYDITSTDILYHISGPYSINMGYTKDALLIAFLCLLIWSLVAKILYFCGIYFTKKNLFAAYVCSDIFVLVVEIIILVFASLIIKAVYDCKKDPSECNAHSCPTTPAVPQVCISTTFVWISTGILIFHIFLKVWCIIISDRVYKSSFSMKLSPQPKFETSEKDTFGFFYTVFLSMKRHPLVAVLIGVSLIICVVNCVYFAGLLIVRYGYSSDTDLSDVLHAITIGYLNMSTIRDNAIIVSLVSISVSFFLQCGKTVSVGMHKPKVTLLILWSELPIVILQLSAISMTSMEIKLVYCCSNDTDCHFHYQDNTSEDFSFHGGSKAFFCSNTENVRDYAVLQFWLMFGFGMLSLTSQVLSIGLGYKYFKRSDDGHLGIFKGVSELFKNIWYKVTDNRYINEKNMPNYSRMFGVFCILMGVGSFIEIVFAISLYTYYFTEGDSNHFLDSLNRFTYYRYNMESLYRGVSITVLVIIPLTTALRVAVFIWFSFRRTTFALYTTYNCMDSAVFRFTEDVEPSRSTACTGLGSTIFVQSGMIVAYIILHIILDIALLIILDAINPYLVKRNDCKRLTMRLWHNIIGEIKKYSKTQRIFLGIQVISVILNFAFWIGIILMGLIPGYFYTQSSFLSNLSSNTKTKLLGVMYSLIPVVPLDAANHVLGTVALFKQKKEVFITFAVCDIILGICDIIYFFFSTVILQSVHKSSALFFGSACVLMAYIVETFIIHITVLVLSLKLVRGFHKRIGDNNENHSLIAMRNIQQELVVNRHHILHAENAIENLRYHQNRNEDLQTERRKKKAGKESEIKDKAENVDNREIRQTIKENGKEQELEQTKSPMRPEGGTVKQRDDEDGILHTMDGGLQNKEKEHSIYNINNTQEKNETE